MSNNKGGRPVDSQSLMWCPDEWKKDYAIWTKSGMGRDEAKRIILDHLELERKRAARS